MKYIGFTLCIFSVERCKVETHQNAQLCHSTPAAWLADRPVNHSNSWLVGMLSCASGMALRCSEYRLCTAPRLGAHPWQGTWSLTLLHYGTEPVCAGFGWLMGGWRRATSSPTRLTPWSGVGPVRTARQMWRRVTFGSEKMSCAVTYQSFHFYSVKHESHFLKKKKKNPKQTWTEKCCSETFTRKILSFVYFFSSLYKRDIYYMIKCDSRQSRKKLHCY